MSIFIKFVRLFSKNSLLQLPQKASIAIASAVCLINLVVFYGVIFFIIHTFKFKITKFVANFNYKIVMKKYFLLYVILLNLTVKSQQWQNNSKITDKVIFNEVMPDSYTVFTADNTLLKEQLQNAGYRFSEQLPTSVVFPINLNGDVETFSVYRTEFMESGLQAKYTNIQTFVGKSTKSGRSIYFAITPYESSFTITSPDANTFFLKTYSKDSYIGFYLGSQHYNDNEFQCEYNNDNTPALTVSAARANDRILRKYRYAVSVTGEYSGYTLLRLGIPSSASVSDKKTAILGAMVIAVTRMNSVYERDVAISLQLVNDNDELIYLDATTDSFDNDTTSMSSLLIASQSSADSNIGTNNYDVGQVWCQGGLQGLARRPAVCSSGIKAKGAARGQNVESDRFIISVASHELGHMFGANHTFSNSGCGGSRNDATAIEAGSGTTIMSYAGICPPNIQDYTDDRFNIASIDEIVDNFTNGSTGSCAEQIMISNNAPIVSCGTNKYIPKETPFLLEATASDADGDTLSYVWEEVDVPNTSITTPPTSTRVSGPLFRPYPASLKSYRYVPILDTLLKNHTSHEWEVLSAVTRYIKFKVTVKDNNIEGGQTASNFVRLVSREEAGPFLTTSDLTPTAWQPNETRTITWDVANTTASPISCSSVDILLSTDGGYTYTTPLLLNTANTGTASITVPNITAVNARYMVKAHDNYFFSLNKGKITIGDFENHCETYTNSSSVVITDNDETTGVESLIQVNDIYAISNVRVSVDVSHTYIQDVKLKLVSPSGTEITLINHACGSQDNLIATFDDSGQNIDCNNLSLGSSTLPAQPLSTLIDETTQGE